MKKNKLLATILSVSMVATLLTGCGGKTSNNEAAGDGGTDAVVTSSDTTNADGEVQEITWMFWDDLNATEDLISKGYADVIERFNSEYEGKYHVTPITTNLEEYYTKLFYSLCYCN